jgi:membrane protein implicated in regulation of membrane protease activity
VLAFLTEMYWGLAILFSLMFAWQLLATLFGHFSGAENVDAGAMGHDIAAGGHDVVGQDGHDGAVHGADTIASFKLLSIRSATAFGLLFGWAGVLYGGEEPPLHAQWVIVYSILWGLVGMVMVSLIFYFLLRMTETGTRRLASALGQRGTVYMDIPAGGTGQIKAVVTNTVSFVNARTRDGQPLKAGTPVVVKRLLDASTVEVDKADE